MGYDFVAIDFETANTYYSSACAIGIVAVRNGEIVDTYYSLINPNCAFYESNTKIHGISSTDVESAPTAADLLSIIQHFFSPDWPIIAHNAYFDISVLRESFCIDETDLWYVDTMDLCRPFMDISLSLKNCAEFFGVPLIHHHNALDDAVCCASIVLKVCPPRINWPFLMQLEGAPGVKKRWISEAKRTKAMFNNKGTSTSYKRKFIGEPKPSEIKRSCSCALCPKHPLYGKKIVFTGNLSFSRKEVMQFAVNAGAILQSSVSSRTDFLVVGEQDKAIVGEKGISTKQIKASELNASRRASIEIINEENFLKLLGLGALSSG